MVAIGNEKKYIKIMEIFFPLELNGNGRKQKFVFLLILKNLIILFVLKPKLENYISL